MEQNKIICISCPIGCRMTIQSKDGKITSIIGNACPKGIKYAEGEFINPLRILPTTVKVISGEFAFSVGKDRKSNS